MSVWLVSAAASFYIGLLFLVAWAGDRRGGPAGRLRPVLYGLTLGVYNTAWSFYGSVGRAVTHGLDFFAIYLGPILVLLLAPGLLARVVRVAKAQNATSIADFLAARYGKSQGLAALVTGAALLATLPYIALQLKGIAASFDVLTGPAAAASAAAGASFDTALAVAVAMAVFAVLFGVRHSHASEHHRGLMLAVAFESLVKLLAFLAVAVSTLWVHHHAIATGLARPSPILAPDLWSSSWPVNTLLSAAALLCLPQMFHVIVVENDQPSDLRVARRLFPAYLMVFTVLLLPVAVAGAVQFGAGPGIDADTFTISLPMAAGDRLVGLVAFLGGLSAATAMVIVASVALSTMICNDVVIPLLLRFDAPVLAGAGDRTRLLLTIRRLAVACILLLAWLTDRVISSRMALVSIGLVSFVAVAQSAPALVGGLVWARGNLKGAAAGLVAGLAVWGGALALPLVVPGAGFGAALGRALGLEPLSAAAILSLGLNVLAYVGVSLATRAAPVERMQASLFVARGGAAGAPRPVTLGDMTALAERFVGRDRTEAAFADWSADWAERLDTPADIELVRLTERLLAGAIGAASARVVVGTVLESRTLSRGEALAMLDDAGALILQRHDLMRITLQHMTQGVCLFDPGLTVRLWNDNWVRLLDLPEDFLKVGLPLADLVAYNIGRGEYGDADLAAQVTERDLAHQRWPYRFERRRPNGTVLELTYVRMPDGWLVGTVGDVTERRQAAEALRESRDLLERRVQERTRELEAQAVALRVARRAAEQANAARARLLAGLSHDLLQPVTAARLFSATLVDRLDGGRRLDGGDAEIAGRLDAALRSVDQLLGDLLDLSALDAGGMTPAVGAVAVGGVLETLGSEFAALGRQRGVAIRVVPSRAIVQSDAKLLRRILQNFMSNAVRYAEGGRVVVGCRQQGDAVSIEVWDDGPGIPPDRLDEIFQDFRRLDAGGPDRGLGLGLAIVDRIARLLGHPVAVRSRPGIATGFAVRVPAVAAPPVTEAPAPEPVGGLAGLRVCCVENDAAILAALTTMLESWGCRIVSDQPDMVVADYHLDDGRTGLDVVRAVRADGGRRVPALIITADRDPAIRRAAEDAGCIVLYKPLKPAALRAALSQLRLSGMAEA